MKKLMTLYMAERKEELWTSVQRISKVDENSGLSAEMLYDVLVGLDETIVQ